MAEQVYIAIAYRWGWANGGHYIVAGGTDQDAVCEQAERECADRGGKYGVEVTKVTDDRDEVHQVIAYYPSGRGEKAVHLNHRMMLFEQVGNRIAQAIEGGWRLDSDAVRRWHKDAEREAQIHRKWSGQGGAS